LVVADSAGDCQILDISNSMDHSYSFFDIETGWLGNNPVLLITGMYFTWHKDPALYIIDDSGVLFGVCGSDIMYKDSRVITFPFSSVWDTCGSLPFIMDDEIDSNYRDFAALQHLSDNWRLSGDNTLEALMNDMFPDLVSCEAERFISATDYSIRFRTTSGAVYDALFNKPNSECYVPWRARSGYLRHSRTVQSVYSASFAYRLFAKCLQWSLIISSFPRA